MEEYILLTAIIYFLLYDRVQCHCRRVVSVISMNPPAFMECHILLVGMQATIFSRLSSTHTLFSCQSVAKHLSVTEMLRKVPIWHTLVNKSWNDSFYFTERDMDELTGCRPFSCLGQESKPYD